MLIPFSRAWNTQRSIDLFRDEFINNRRMIDGKPRYPGPTELRVFLNNLGTKDAIIDFLCTPYHGPSRKIKAEERGTPFQTIIENMSANYIHVLRGVIGDEWENLVDRHSQEGRFALRLVGPNQADRLNVLLGGLPETKRKNVVNDLLTHAIEISDESSIPALRQVLFGDGRKGKAKWAKALVEDRYIFTAISEDASSTTIEALLNGLTPAQYREVLMAVDPENGTDPIPLIMQVMLSEDWALKQAIAERLKESDWENLLTGDWSERFITNVTEDEYADELLSFILKYLSDDCILRVAQANKCFLLKQIVCSEDYDLYVTLLNNIKNQNIQERVFSLIKEIAKNAENIFYYTDDSNRKEVTISVPAFILRDTYNSVAGKAEEVEAPEDLSHSYTCFEDLASPAP